MTRSSAIDAGAMRKWRSLHTWFGLGAGLFVLMSALTGLVLQLPELTGEPWPHTPPELAGPPAPVTEILRRAEAEVGAKVGQLNLAYGARDMWVARMQNGDTLFLAPGGETIAHHPPRRFGRVLDLALDLHKGTIVGLPGVLVVMLAASGLIVSVLTGVVLWPWLRKRVKRGALSG